MTRWSDTRLRRLAWAGWWAVAVSTVVNGVVTSINDPESSVSWGSASFLGEVTFVVVVLTFPLVGLLILLRQPRNTVGWLLQGVGLSWTFPGPLDAYAHYGLLIDPGSVPGPEIAAALLEGTWVLGIGMMGIFLILLFPDGHLPSPRWRPVAWAGGISVVAVTILIPLTPGRLEEGPIPGVDNPIAVESWATVISLLLVIALPLVPVCILASAAALVLRFRRSHGVERQQIKWLATAAAAVAVLYAVAMLSTLVGDMAGVEAADGSWTGTASGLITLFQELSLASFLLMPLAIGVAILRHRLFDIDLVINRALVYGSLTATLATVYLGSVLVLQLVLRPLTVDSDLAVAASTLAVAAAFGPARRAIQTMVDRRFYRRRYDAALALDAFTGRLRHQVDLDAVGADLLAAVHETVQPTHATVWLPRTRRPS